MNLVLITSVINTTSSRLSYTDTRSCYTNVERFNQTMQTIDSIKNRIINAKIILVECSNLNEKQNKYLSENCDYILNLYGNEDLKNIILHHESKALGEGTQTIKALEYIIENKIVFKNLIKISGRYMLSEDFDIAKFNNDNIVVKKINDDNANILTAIYKLPCHEVPVFLDFLKANKNLMENKIGFEILFGIFIQNRKNVVYHNPMGLKGYVSVDGSKYNG